MAEIKSALEKAMERAEKMGLATEEEMKQDIYLDEGRRLAARYLREEDVELTDLFEPAKAPSFLLKGIQDTLLRNIALPRDEDIEKNIKKAMQGILVLKRNNTRARKILAQIDEILRQYRRTILDAREQLKARFGMKFGGLQEQIEKQLHAKLKIDVEQQPQFQEDWLQILTEINARFSQFLEQQKELLKSV